MAEASTVRVGRGAAELSSLARTLRPVAKQKTFDFPDDLLAAQAVLDAARAAYGSYCGALPKWAEPMPERDLRGGATAAAEPGWSAEQRTEEARLLEAERQAAHAVWAHPFWASLSRGDVVDARTGLRHLPVAGA